MTAALLWGRQVAPGFRSGVARVALWLATVAVLLGLAARPSLAADEPASRFVWDSVSVTVRLLDDGSLRVREDDTVQFTGGPFRQGYREIPLTEIDSISEVTVTEVGVGDARRYQYVRPDQYSRNTSRTFTYQQVGTTMRIDWSFPPTTSTTRSWVIEYLARGALRVYDDAQPPYQEIWWIGVDRELTQTAPVNTATLAFILPRAVDPKATKAASNGTSLGGKNGQAWFWRAERLTAGDTLQASLRFPPLVEASKPAWQVTLDRQLTRETPANLAFLGLALLTAVGGSVGLLAAWWTRGRDPLPGPTPERLTEPPDDTPPGIVGALLDERVDERDYLATLIDLARRDIVHISGVAQPVASRNQPMVLTLLKPDAPLKPFERALLAALFPQTWWRHAQVRLPLDDPTGLREALRRVEALLYEELVQRGYFTAPPPDTRETWRYAGIGLWLLAVIVLLGGVVAVSSITWVLLASLVLVAVGSAVFVVSRHMPQKTRAGAEAAARWKAFRSHMEAVDRVGARDGGQAGFERYLPYAVAFGVEQPWIDAFARGATASPGWREAVNLDGDWIPDGGRTGTKIPAQALAGADLHLPTLPHPGGLQNVSSLTAASLQSTSGTLFDMFNEVSDAFRPERVFGNMDIDGGDIALRVGLEVLDLALSGGKGGHGSGGGGGGFS